MTTGTHNDGGDEEQHPEGTEIPEGISEEMSADDYLVAKKKKKKPISTRPKSATVEHPEEGHLPTAVNTQEQLVNVPAMYLSDNPKRPLLLTVEGEGERPPYTYALNPLTYSVLAILAIEGLERFAYYGINNNETEFLTGGYDPTWNANLTSVQAVSFTSASIAIAYTTPFVGGILADGFTGEFWAIVIGISVFYLPGLLLIALSTFPGLLGPTFNITALKWGMLGLMPTGTGFIKPLVNVFGAKQYHPVVQSTLIEPYYVNFYMVINVGSLVGGFMIALVAEKSDEIAFFIPFVAMCCGFLLFLCLSPRYVKRKPEKTALFNTLGLFGKSIFCCKSFTAAKESKGGLLSDTFVDGVWRLLKIIPVNLLVLPFNIVYNCVTTIFILQGQAMQEEGVVNASLMGNWDAISVLITGFIASKWLYPCLEKRGIHFPYSYRFALGSAFGALAIASALIVDAEIRHEWNTYGNKVNIFAQTMDYVFVGAGELFAIATAFAAAFIIAPKEQKALASAIQLFMSSGLASYIQIGLQQGFKDWLPTSPGVQPYVDSQMDKFLWVLFGISCAAIGVNLLPPIKNWLENLLEESLESAMDKTNDTKVTIDSMELSIKNDDEGDHHNSASHRSAVAMAESRI